MKKILIIVSAIVLIAVIVAVISNLGKGLELNSSTTTSTTTSATTTTTASTTTTTTTSTTTSDHGGESGGNDNPKVDLIPSEGLQFDLSNDKKSYYVSKGTCTDSVIVIPETYNGLPVSAIAAGGFSRCTWLTDIVIPESVVSIGAQAFADCTALESITLPVSIVSLGGMEFKNCTALQAIIFEGTTEQWDAIFKYDWSMNTGVPASAVVCRDGTVKLK